MTSAAEPKRSKPRAAAAASKKKASSTDESKPDSSAPSDSKPAAPNTRLSRAEWVKYLALCVFSGTIWFLACPDFDLWPLAWFAMVPTLYVTERVHTTRQAFFFAWITGIVGNGGGFYWIAGLLVRFGHMPWIAATPIFLLLAGYQGLVFGTFGAVTRLIRKHSKLPMALVAPLVIVAFEQVIPMIFPFSVAITQAWQTHVIQVADLAGPLGVAALLLAANGAIYDVALEKPRRLVPAGIAAGVIVAALVYGHIRIGQTDRARAAAPKITVGIVQTNVAFDMKGPNRARFAAHQLEELHTQTAELQREGAELVVWPETAFPYTMSRQLEQDYPERDLRRLRVGYDVPTLVGAVTWAPREGLPNGRAVWNSAIMMDREGHFTGREDKIWLMMFGEYTPGRETFSIIARLMPSTTGQFQHGEAPHTLPFTDAQGRAWKLGPMICYEDIISDFGRQLSDEHPHLLVNMTNDSWFGDTSEPWEHLALSVFRAVEMRTDLVRSVNTGVSAFVDANGRVFHRTYAVDPTRHPRGGDRAHAQVALVEGGHTLYAKIGNVFSWLCVLGTAFLWLIRPRLAKKKSGGEPKREAA